MGRITWRKPVQKKVELIDTIEQYTDGEIFTMQMEEIIKTLSAARAPKKDGKGIHMPETIAHHMPLLTQCDSIEESLRG